MKSRSASSIAGSMAGGSYSASAFFQAFREVAPGTHFLGCAHTQANFETAFYRSSLADNNSVEQWEAEGAQDAAQRANKAWKKALAEYQAPPIDPAIDEALRDFIERKKASLPDAAY